MVKQFQENVRLYNVGFLIYSVWLQLATLATVGYVCLSLQGTKLMLCGLVHFVFYYLFKNRNTQTDIFLGPFLYTSKGNVYIERVFIRMYEMLSAH